MTIPSTATAGLVSISRGGALRARRLPWPRHLSWMGDPLGFLVALQYCSGERRGAAVGAARNRAPRLRAPARGRGRTVAREQTRGFHGCDGHTRCPLLGSRNPRDAECGGHPSEWRRDEDPTPIQQSRPRSDDLPFPSRPLRRRRAALHRSACGVATSLVGRGHGLAVDARTMGPSARGAS